MYKRWVDIKTKVFSISQNKSLCVAGDMLQEQHLFSPESFEISIRGGKGDKTTRNHVRKTEQGISGGLYRKRLLPIKPDFIKPSGRVKAFS